MAEAVAMRRFSEGCLYRYQFGESLASEPADVYVLLNSRDSADTVVPGSCPSDTKDLELAGIDPDSSCPECDSLFVNYYLAKFGLTYSYNEQVWSGIAYVHRGSLEDLDYGPSPFTGYNEFLFLGWYPGKPNYGK